VILQSLVQLAKTEKLIADPDFELKPVAWIIRLKGDGTLVGIDDHRIDLNTGQVDKRGKPVKPKWVGRDVLVPIQAIRTSGDAAAFLVDKAEYVLGVDPAGKREPEKLLKRLLLFYQSADGAAAASGDAGLRAVVAFGKKLATRTTDDRTKLLPKDCGPSDLFMFKIGTADAPAHLAPAVQAYWKGQRTPTGDGQPADRRCLVTGEPMSEAGLFRLLKNVPGGTTSGVSLVSFNSPAWESYGWEGNENAPISRDAAEAAAAALNRLLDPRPTTGTGDPLPVRRIRLGDDTVVVFWSPEAMPQVQSVLDQLPDLFDPKDDATDVGNLVASPKTGVFKPLSEPARFYAMTLTGTQGRVVMRDWLESSVTEIQSNLAAYFADLQLFRPGDASGNGNLVAPVDPPSYRDVKLAVFRAFEDVPAPFGRQWLRVAWGGKTVRVPAAVASKVVTRVRIALARGDQMSPHALCVLKLHVLREGDRTVKAYLNEDHDNPAYHCGRLLAVLDFAQQRALPGTNTTNVRRTLGAIMAAPALYMGRLRKLTEIAYLRHLSVSWQKFIRDRIQSISSQLSDGLPPLLSLKDQSTFLLGMDQERTYLQSHPPTRYKYQTSTGTWVLSVGEQRVAEALAKLGHRFLYEPGLKMRGSRERLPDFMVLRGNKPPYFIEYLGMLDDEEYRKRWEEKLADYLEFGIKPIEEGGGAKGTLIVISPERQPDYQSVHRELHKLLGDISPDAESDTDTDSEGASE
jgi:CRISPR-associated protein Csd1